MVKTSGLKGIYTEMLKNGTEKLYTGLTYIINKCLNRHQVPEPVESSIYRQFTKKEINKTVTTIEVFQ